jgi:hypothetical protein
MPGGPIFDYRAPRRLSDIYCRKQRHIGIHNVVEGLCDKSNRAKRVPILITEGNELLPVAIKSGTRWLPGIPTRVYSHMLMPTGILLTGRPPLVLGAPGFPSSPYAFIVHSREPVNFSEDEAQKRASATVANLLQRSPRGVKPERGGQPYDLFDALRPSEFECRGSWFAESSEPPNCCWASGITPQFRRDSIRRDPSTA